MEWYEIVVPICWFIWFTVFFIFCMNIEYILFYYKLERHNKRYINKPDLQIVIPKKYKDLKKLCKDFNNFVESSELLHYIYDSKFNKDSDSDGK